ncbi:MAG: helix-hairpin-helix domain-containing protein [Deltaproteobacteria bacterium]|nr:helix-hairpin-helix domain-containing protein [Deltaproteobacteria bacterium]
MRGVRLITLGLPVDLNRATQEDLEALPGVGPALAARILAYRRSHGPFKRVEDLEEVQGIGPKVLAVIKPHVIIGSLGPAMRRPPNKP